MYKIQVLTRGFEELTTIFTPNVYDIKYTEELNKPGGASFKINVADPKANNFNLKLFNRVVFYKDSVGKFIGFIDSMKVGVNTIDVTCIGMLGVFTSRLTSSSFNVEPAGDSFFELLTNTNALDFTGVTIGVTDVVQNIAKIDFKRSTVLAAWQKIANMAAGEFKVNIDRTLDFKTELGTDKSGTIKLQFNINQLNTANIFDFNVDVDSKDMANKVTGLRDSGTSVQEDAASIALYGLIETTQSFLQTGDAGDLISETTNYLNDHKQEFYTPTIRPNTDKINLDPVNTGDTVNVYLNNGFVEVSQNHRVIRKAVTVSNNGNEIVDLGLIPVTTNLLPSSFADDIISLKQRLSLIEGTII